MTVRSGGCGALIGAAAAVPTPSGEIMRRSFAVLAAAAAAVALGGCATIVENRVENALAEAGVPATMASCMAGEWADRLTISQIRGIQRFANNVRGEGTQLTPARLIAHARTWNDPQALQVVTVSAARCAFR
jgi:hypothetical protein